VTKETTAKEAQLLADTALVKLAQSGRRWAMDELLRRHSATMRRLASRMLSGGADTEDVLQEAFVRAYQALPSFKGTAAFSTWLYRIVVNACLMYRRKRVPYFVSLDASGSGEGDGHSAIEKIAHLRPVTPLDLLLQHEQTDKLLTAVEDLPPSLKVPFVLTELSDIAIPEGARSLNMGVGAYRTRLYRARNRVRSALRAIEEREGEPTTAVA